MSFDHAQNTHAWALFLDVDGTLLQIAETPQDVRVPQALTQLLQDLHARLNGALALVSGRSIANLDQLFAPLQLCAAGVHGCERRDPEGRLHHASVDLRSMAAAHEELARCVRMHDGLLLEDKGYGVAVHFRRAPHLAAEVHSVTRRVCANLGPSFTVQAGKCVFEIRPAAATKGAAISAFMKQPPFSGRKPVFLGDDVTDEHGFLAVNKLGGTSIRVGAAAYTEARFRLPGVVDVIHWLGRLRSGELPALHALS